MSLMIELEKRAYGGTADPKTGVGEPVKFGNNGYLSQINDEVGHIVVVQARYPKSSLSYQ